MQDFKQKLGGIMPQRQKGYYSIRIKMAGGDISSDSLRAIADATEAYRGSCAHITTRQGIEISNVREEDVDSLADMLYKAGLQIGISGTRIRNVMACQGNKVCRHGHIDCQHLANIIDKKFVGATVSKKFKIAISGCSSACSKPQYNDFGIMGVVYPLCDRDMCQYCMDCVKACRVGAMIEKGDKVLFNMERCDNCGDCILACHLGAISAEKTGYRVYVGGNAGRFSKKGIILTTVFDEDSVLSILEKTIEYYNYYSEDSERLGDVLERMGMGHYTYKVLSD